MPGGYVAYDAYDVAPAGVAVGPAGVAVVPAPGPYGAYAYDPY
jgi:hypothetical protein